MVVLELWKWFTVCPWLPLVVPGNHSFSGWLQGIRSLNHILRSYTCYNCLIVSGCGGSTLTEYCHPVQSNSLISSPCSPLCICMSPRGISVIFNLFWSILPIGDSLIKFKQNLPFRKTFLRILLLYKSQISESLFIWLSSLCAWPQAIV